MRKIILASLLAVILCGSALGASKTELARMGTFISNFTEQGMYNVNIDNITSEELVHFGIWHNYINNFKSRIKRCPKKNCPYGSLIIDKKYVAESVRKYFDIDIDHTSTDNEHYDGKVYHFEGADGERTYYADVNEVTQRGNIITMRGELYAAEDEDDRPATFVAEAKTYKYNGKNTWSLHWINTEWEE